MKHPFAPIALSAALSLAGCASFSGIEPAAQLATPAAVGALETSVDWPQPQWWKRYGDRTLDGLIDKALADSPSLKLAEARVAKARAQAGIAESALWPRLDAGADSTRKRISEHGESPPPLAGTVQTISHARLSAGWEVDFFGRNRAALDAALGSARAAQADAQAARVLLATEVARTYFTLARLIEQRETATATLTQREAIRELVSNRVQAGLDTNVELRQAEGAIPEIRRDTHALDEQIALTRHALAALTAQGPDAADGLAPRLSAASVAQLPSAIPVDLIGHRADVSAARWRVQAALRDVDSARAQFYPDINLLGFVGFASIGFSQWLVAGSREAGVGAAIHLPIFDAGRLRANLRGKTADADAAVESYNATLIEAVREVADQIASLQWVSRQADEERAAREAAERAYELALQRYRAGLGTYLSVLTAETNVLTQRRIATDLKARGIDAGLELTRALGGGYAEHMNTQAANR